MKDADGGAELRTTVFGLMRSSCWQEAIKVLRLDRSVVEKDWELSWNLGWCYFKLERFKEARKYLIRVAKLAPSNWVCKWGLASCYLKIKQFRKAETLLLEALRIKDGYLPRISLALAYLAQGKLAEAEKVHLESISLKPKESRRYEAYACFLEDVGRAAKATRMHRKARLLRAII